MKNVKGKNGQILICFKYNGYVRSTCCMLVGQQPPYNNQWMTLRFQIT